MVNLFYNILLVLTASASILESASIYSQRSIRSDYDQNPIYILVSTSSKIYCMKMPDLNRINSVGHANYMKYLEDLKNYVVIYQEKSSSNANWITDAFYVKSEDLIYVNVYNSTAASSEIFTLKYDKVTDVWQKTVLYKDQSYCLGITYNQDKKELYWTAGKSIVSGNSVAPSKQPKVLFNLDSAKKLLYLKYDQLIDTVYVSTLNYVYSCSFSQPNRDDCKIIARDLQSARGLYLDAVNRHLYVVDHKKRNLKKIKLKTFDQAKQEELFLSQSPSTSMIYNNLLASYQQFDQINNGEMDSSNGVKTILSQEIMPDIGDIFYMCLYKNRYNINILMWTEFSGKVKVSSLNNTADYKVLFSTNEYTYSINIMDNSTSLSPQPQQFIRTNPSQTFTSTSIASMTQTSELRSTTPETTSTRMPLSTTVFYSTNQEVTTTTTANLWVETSRFTYEDDETTTPVSSSETMGRTTTHFIRRTTTQNLRTDSVSSEDEYANEIDETTNQIDSSAAISFLPTATTTMPRIPTTDMKTSPIATSKITMQQKTIEFSQNSQKEARYNDLYDAEDPKSANQKNGNKNLNKIQSFRAVSNNNNSKNNKNQNENELLLTQMSTRSPSTYNLLRSSPQLNVALYIVICLLCFSLVVNIILLYFSKMKQKQQSRDNNLIITHEICDKIAVCQPSQRSNSGSTTKTSNSGDLGECNINLIQSNGSATSCIDSDH